MPRVLRLTRAGAEVAAPRLPAGAWLDSLGPATTPAENPSDLRRIGLALRGLAEGQRELDEAVAAARKNGRNWGQTGLVLGISRQAARERYPHPAARS